MSSNHYPIIVVMFKFARKILSFGMKSFYEQKSLTKKFHMISQLFEYILFTKRTRVHDVSYTSI
jgi:hypothetical protein